MRRTNIELDEKLLKEAMKLSRKKTIKEVVNFALQEFVIKKRRKGLLGLVGKVKWSGNLDEMRKSRV